MKNVVSIRLSDKLKSQVKELADKEDRSLSNFIERLVKERVSKEKNN